jgi:cell division septum initiation protein DivIVA
LQIGQNEIHVELPRAVVGGLKKRNVEDVLLRIARDYKKLELENRRLWETLEKLEAHPTPGDEKTQAGQSAAGSSAEITVFAEVLPPEPASARQAADASIGSELAGPNPVSHERREPDALASAVLSVAHRAAREMRASTREECELMLKKARSRAERLERETERARSETVAELEQIQALKSELREHMRSSLQALLHTFVLERSGQMPPVDWNDEPNFVFSVMGEEAREKPRKKKSKL